jgi:hypothetical protein
MNIENKLCSDCIYGLSAPTVPCKKHELKTFIALQCISNIIVGHEEASS